jgi:hypothetical protein
MEKQPTTSFKFTKEDRSTLATAKSMLENENPGVKFTVSSVIRAALYFFVARKKADKSNPTRK